MRICLGLILAVLAGTRTAADSAPVCWKDTRTRGVGKPIHACHNGYEKNGALCYPVCRDGYYGVGPVCWQHCQQGWVDEGALCRKSGSIKTVAKKSYGRGAGTPLVCADDEDEDAALCYPKCDAGFDGVGPVCWIRCPTATDPVDGGALCCRDGPTCSDKIKQLSAGLPIAVMKALLAGGNVTKIEQDVKQAVEAVLGFVMPLCSNANATVTATA